MLLELLSVLQLVGIIFACLAFFLYSLGTEDSYILGVLAVGVVLLGLGVVLK